MVVLSAVLNDKGYAVVVALADAAPVTVPVAVVNIVKVFVEVVDTIHVPLYAVGVTPPIATFKPVLNGCDVEVTVAIVPLPAVIAVIVVPTLTYACDVVKVTNVENKLAAVSTYTIWFVDG